MNHNMITFHKLTYHTTRHDTTRHETKRKSTGSRYAYLIFKKGILKNVNAKNHYW